MFAPHEKLSSRPAPRTKAGPITVHSNLFRFNCRKGIVIRTASLHCSPNIPGDARALYDEVLLACKTSLEKLMGMYAMSGNMAFFLTELREKQYEIKDHPKYTLLVKTKRSYSLDEESKGCGQAALHLLLNLYSETFKNMGFKPGEKKTLMIDQNLTRRILGTKLQIRKGFDFKINKYEGGLFLKMTPVTRLIREDTALQSINTIYQNQRPAPKEQIRQMVRTFFKGRLVMVSYASKRLYRIQDVIFDKDIREIPLDGDGKMTLFDYYNKIYHFKVTNPKAPLLQVQTKSKNEILLISELCKMVGEPDVLEEQQRKKLTENAFKKPDEKLAPVQNLINKLLKSGFDSSRVGVKLNNEFERIDAKALIPNDLKLGGGGIISTKGLNFNYHSYKFYRCENEMRVHLIHFMTNKSQSVNLIKNIQSISKSFQIKLNIMQHYLQRDKQHSLIEFIEHLIADFPGPNTVIFAVLPNNMKTIYPKLKKLLLCNHAILSQIMLESSLSSGKNLQSIITKVVIQIATKAGNVPWNPKLPEPINKAMLVGFDQVLDGRQYQLAMVSTTSNDFSRYFSRSMVCESALISKIDELLVKAIEKYYQENKYLPIEIIILRSGVFRDDIVKQEITFCKRALQKLSEMEAGYKPSFIFLTVDRRPGEFFFVQENGVLKNPPSGIVIANSVFGSNIIYMIPQNVNRGSARPILYNIHCYESKLDRVALTELLLDQCYNYMNWTGPIRIPSVVMYASRLAKMCRECLKGSVAAPLQHRLCYI